MYSNNAVQSQGHALTRPTPSLFQRMLAHHKRQQEYSRLLDQPDYVLEDVGVTREQVIAAKRGMSSF